MYFNERVSPALATASQALELENGELLRGIDEIHDSTMAMVLEVRGRERKGRGLTLVRLVPETNVVLNINCFRGSTPVFCLRKLSVMFAILPTACFKCCTCRLVSTYQDDVGYLIRAASRKGNAGSLEFGGASMYTRKQFREHVLPLAPMKSMSCAVLVCSKQ